MANVEIVERENKRTLVDITSLDGMNVCSIPYELWQEVKDYFGIDENTVDAYTYVKKYERIDADYVLGTISISSI